MKSETNNDAKTSPIVLGAKAKELVQCVDCKKEGDSETFFRYQKNKGGDMYLCAECRDTLNARMEADAKNTPMWRVYLMGSIASIVGASIWYMITSSINMEFGYVSIGLGYLVAYAVLWAAGWRRSRKLQIASLAFTILGILIAEYLIFSDGLFKYMSAHPTDFPDWDGAKVWLDPWAPIIWTNVVTPIGLLIYAIGAYVAYVVPKRARL